MGCVCAMMCVLRTQLAPLSVMKCAVDDRKESNGDSIAGTVGFEVMSCWISIGGSCEMCLHHQGTYRKSVQEGFSPTFHWWRS